ncbi:MAG: hypothetical protein LBK50_01610, partial [Candidatus Nomurabacteria bacterium]|nr:hypothetical protein [Candidatus Nomurabacteria bacterium]
MGKKIILAISIVVCVTVAIVLSRTLTHADSNITLTINNEKTLTLSPNTCTPFILDTITTTNNTLGYNMKVYL